MECEIQKWHRETLEKGKRGRWCTKTYLSNELHWTKRGAEYGKVSQPTSLGL